MPEYRGKARCGGCVERCGAEEPALVEPVWADWLGIWVCPDCNNNLSHQSEQIEAGVWRQEPYYTRLHAHDGTPLAQGYVRIVHGGRGDYVEIDHAAVLWDNFHIPADQAWRFKDPNWIDKVYYVEYRSKGRSNVKLYDQKRLVGYADYKIGMCYIDPADIVEELT